MGALEDDGPNGLDMTTLMGGFVNEHVMRWDADPTGRPYTSALAPHQTDDVRRRDRRRAHTCCRLGHWWWAGVYCIGTSSRRRNASDRLG